jgi:hypothetical protein
MVMAGGYVGLPANAASTSGGLSLEVPNGDGVQSCTATDVILIAGSQYELGSTPSSYIPTAGATVTRAAETLTVPAANLPYNSTNMSIQMDGKMTYADTGVQYEVQQYRWRLVDSANLISTSIATSGGKTGQPVFTQRQSTSGTDSVSGGNTDYSPDVNVPFNLAARHGSTFLNGAHEGTLLTANTTPTILPDLSATDLELGQLFMGTIGQFRMWDDDLTDARYYGGINMTDELTGPKNDFLHQANKRSRYAYSTLSVFYNEEGEFVSNTADYAIDVIGTIYMRPQATPSQMTMVWSILRWQR